MLDREGGSEGGGRDEKPFDGGVSAPQRRPSGGSPHAAYLAEVGPQIHPPGDRAAQAVLGKCSGKPCVPFLVLFLQNQVVIGNH